MVASTYEIDPVLCFDGLLKQQQSPTKPGKFLMTNVYNYFVLLHDVNDEADSKYENTSKETTRCLDRYLEACF